MLLSVLDAGEPIGDRKSLPSGNPANRLTSWTKALCAEGSGLSPPAATCFAKSTMRATCARTSGLSTIGDHPNVLMQLASGIVSDGKPVKAVLNQIGAYYSPACSFSRRWQTGAGHDRAYSTPLASVRASGLPSPITSADPGSAGVDRRPRSAPAFRGAAA